MSWYFWLFYFFVTDVVMALSSFNSHFPSDLCTCWRGQCVFQNTRQRSGRIRSHSLCQPEAPNVILCQPCSIVYSAVTRSSLFHNLSWIQCYLISVSRCVWYIIILPPATTIPWTSISSSCHFSSSLLFQDSPSDFINSSLVLFPIILRLPT